MEKKYKEAGEDADELFHCLTKRYNSIYIVDLVEEKLIPYVMRNEVAKSMESVVNSGISYNQIMNEFCERYVLEVEKNAYLEAVSIPQIIAELARSERYNFTFFRYDIDRKIELVEMSIMRVDSNKDKAVMTYRTIKEKSIDIEHERNEVQKRNAETLFKREEALQAVSNLFYTVYAIDIKNNSITKIRSLSRIAKDIDNAKTAQEAFKLIIQDGVKPAYRKLIGDLLDMESWKKKFKNSDSISAEYEGEFIEWCRLSIIASKRDSQGCVTDALLCGQDISQDKKNELEQKSMLEETKEKLEESYDIMRVLCSDYGNIYVVNLKADLARIVKINDHISSCVREYEDGDYPYTKLCRYYIEEQVLPEDMEGVINAMSIDTVRKKLAHKNEYVYGYRIIDKGEIHNYKVTYFKLEDDDNLIVAFKNVDDIVETLREHESLKILSETDIMTKLTNRGCGERLSNEALAKRPKGMFCILDVDKFKIFNDTYGHHVGDKVLIEVAAALRKAFRSKDIVFRLGGDEFAVMALDVEETKSAEKMIERLFELIDRIGIPEVKDIKISISVGAILFDDKKEYTFEYLYKKADTCVYISKGTEGNKVSFYNI